MKAWLQRFMYGRYGQDDLGRFLMIAALLVYIASLWTRWAVVTFLAVLLLALCIFRMLSRDAGKRGAENRAFLRIYERCGGFFSETKNRFRQRKTHRFYSCPACKQPLRVPKGKGHITIHCPKCKTSFDKRT